MKVSEGDESALAGLDVIGRCRLMYGVGLIRLWRNAGYGHGIRPLEANAFAADGS